MKSLPSIHLSDVQAVYAGPEGDLWELVMGQQIHIGGLQSSLALAERAAIQPGTHGVDLCCCTGAGMRFLVRFCNVARMTGVDATSRMVERGKSRNREEGLADKIDLVIGDASATGLASNAVDFVWGEDAWCYVEDKTALIAEAARLVKPGGTIAFTDWVEGSTPLDAAQANRMLAFMKFPNVQDIAGYSALLAANGCEVVCAQDTGRMPACMDLYINMLTMQLSYDALKIIGFDQAMMGMLGQEMEFMRSIAHQRKLVQAMFVARKRG